MTGVGRFLMLCACLPMVVGVVGCGQDDERATGTNALTVEVVNLVGAEGSQLTGELSKNVDYGHTAPTWPLLSTTVTASPFSFSDTVAQLPEGEFDLTVQAGLAGTSEAAKVKGQACELSLTLGKDEKVTVTIDGLNEFGEKGYGECAATITR